MRERCAGGLDGEYGAGLGRCALELHRAGAALAGVATHLCAGQPCVLADEVDKQLARLNLSAVGLPVDSDLHWYLQLHTPLERYNGSAQIWPYRPPV